MPSKNSLQPPAVTPADIIEFERELYKRSFSEFVKAAWHVLEPGQPYVHNWHMDAICLPGETLIETDGGPKTISDIVESKWGGRVLSANHKLGSLEWRSIVSHMRSPADSLFEITTMSGLKFKATGNHPVFVLGKGYVRADQVRAGDAIVELSKLQNKFPEEACHQRDVLLSPVPLRTQESDHSSREGVRLQALPKEISQKPKKSNWRVLLNALLRGLESKPRKLSVSIMWNAEGLGRQKVPEVLLAEQEERADAPLPPMPGTCIQKSGETRGILAYARSILQQRLPRKVRSRTEQCRIRGWKAGWRLWARVPTCEGEDSKKGRREVLLMQQQGAAGRSSYRQGQVEQRRTESSDAVQELSCRAASTSVVGHKSAVTGVVTKVARQDCLSECLYNIEVEGNNNYFANGVLVHNCDHLTAISTGEIKRLLINVPPGTSKSSLVSIYHTAWEWGPAGMPHIRFIGGSHEQGLAIRDNRRMRMLVSSEWYQKRWPMALAGDQNAKLYFENEHSGFRQACSIESMTGRRGDRVAIDDPHSATGALSDVKRETTLTEFRETVPSRLTNPADSAIIVIMQRLHEGDVAGHILEHEHDYVHLCLPMEYERERHCKTRIGFSDPRTEDGELLFPARFPADVVEGYKRTMGEYAYAAQMQQRPAPRTGGFFKWERFEIVKVAQTSRRMARYWDKAGTEGGGARTAGVLMSVSPDGVYYIHNVIKGQWSALERERVIRQTAETDGKLVDIWIEQEPGSGGKESAEATIRNLAGYKIKAERPTGEKAVRAEPYSAQVEAGNIKLVSGEWNKEFIDEHKTFPVGKYKDQIDAAAGAFNKLAVPAYNIFGLV